ncbi:MAG: hypothetical protein AB7D07_00505 [Desulfovibrionaceae bacterium]|jgi:cell division FtsZ-interacting protein ZapD
MGESEIHRHHLRISNCLRTILDLEEDVERLEMGHTLIKEFQTLKDFLEQLERVDVQEEDVDRIETATAHFLEELRGPLSQRGGGSPRRRLVQ